MIYFARKHSRLVLMFGLRIFGIGYDSHIGIRDKWACTYEGGWRYWRNWFAFNIFKDDDSGYPEYEDYRYYFYVWFFCFEYHCWLGFQGNYCWIRGLV